MVNWVSVGWPGKSKSSKNHNVSQIMKSLLLLSSEKGKNKKCVPNELNQPTFKVTR